MRQTNKSAGSNRRFYIRLIVILLLAALIVPTVFTCVQMGVFTGEPKLEIRSTVTDPDAPVLRVATDYDFCPNSYYNENGELSGLYIELMNDVANRLGARLEFKTGTWLECRQMLTDGDADVLLGLEIFSNMEGTLRTIPICSDDLRVYGKEGVDSVAALAGKRVALMARSVIEATYDLQCEYVEYNTNSEILQAVEDGEADYAICHAAVSSKIIEKNGLHLVQGLSIARSYPALAIDDDRPELKTQLNNVLQQMSTDGTIGRLKDKWITEFTRNKSLTYVLTHNQIFYVTFFFCVLVTLCIFIFFMLWDSRRSQYINSLLVYQQQLKDSNEAAMRANRSKTVFLSHMSHDIRTPLNGILGMAARIRKNKEDPQIVDDCLNKIGVASGHLLSLLSDVLDMSELEHGEVELERKPFDLSAELNNICIMVNEQVQAATLTLSLHAESLTHTALIGSPVHLRRILLNLISNAIKYNRPDGRIDLTVQEIRANEEQAQFQFIVADTGIGMSQEFVDQYLYKPFTQENDNVRTTYQGTGLGMSIVDELVRTMGGTIAVTSQRDVGTTFTLCIPFAIDPHPLTGTEKPEVNTDISGMRILIAEDNELNREIAQYMLEEAGAQAVCAENGREAVSIFAASEIGSFDAILMDIMMPVIDGIQATQEVRALPRADAATVPIIAMTANAFAEDRKKSIAAGMNAHLTKPVESEKLYEILAKYKTR